MKLLCRPQIEHIQQDAEDNSEPSEHPDVFPTPEKTESLINLSQVDVPTDSTYSLTPAISNMIIPCMSKCDCCNLSFCILHYCCFACVKRLSHTSLFCISGFPISG